MLQQLSLSSLTSTVFSCTNLSYTHHHHRIPESARIIVIPSHLPPPLLPYSQTINSATTRTHIPTFNDTRAHTKLIRLHKKRELPERPSIINHRARLDNFRKTHFSSQSKISLSLFRQETNFLSRRSLITIIHTGLCIYTKIDPIDGLKKTVIGQNYSKERERERERSQKSGAISRRGESQVR